MKTLLFSKELPSEEFLKKISKRYVWSLLIFLQAQPCRFYDLETHFLINKRELSYCLKRLRELGFIQRTHITKDRDYLAYESTNKGKDFVKRVRELKRFSLGVT